MTMGVAVNRHTMNSLLLLSILFSTVCSFRYDPLKMSRARFYVSHWDYDLEPFAFQPNEHGMDTNDRKIHPSGSVGTYFNHSQETDGTTVCVFKQLEDEKIHENRFVCVYGAECCDTDGCCFGPNPGATLQAITLFMLSILGCILIISLCLVLKSKTQRDLENQVDTRVPLLLTTPLSVRQIDYSVIEDSHSNWSHYQEDASWPTHSQRQSNHAFIP